MLTPMWIESYIENNKNTKMIIILPT